ncbi:MAG: outer membrane beta-barrel protein [Polaromonas sp.]|nr:outer membrane beta-barrel protein [Polaromonas sp.]
MKSFSRIATATLVSVAALTTGMAANAQTTGSGFSMYQPGSGYIGLNAGRSDYNVGSGNGVFGSDDNDDAYNIYGGSYFSQYFGLEVGFTDFGKISRLGGRTDAEGINLSLVGRLPLSPAFSLNAKVGTTYGRTKVSANPLSGVTGGKESGWGVSYGIGAEYAFTPAWSAVLQYDEHKLDFAGSGDERIGATTVGVRYRF